MGVQSTNHLFYWRRAWRNFGGSSPRISVNAAAYFIMTKWGAGRGHNAPLHISGDTAFQLNEREKVV
jgi:hypothetical protein